MNIKKRKWITLTLGLAIILVFGWYFIFNQTDKSLEESNDNYYIAAFIDGEASTTFPTTKDYNAEVTCKKGDAVVDIGAKITWTGSKWKLSVSDASVSDVACNIKFVTKPTWSNPGTGTLLAAIKSSNTVKSPSTTPGSAISTSTEKVLASTSDDYGTSYYFRGAVTNNFVEYANMCWRIVRVTGDGSIKLVLYNYNGLTDSNNTPASSTPCNVTGNNYAFARYEGDTYTSVFNSNYYDNAYVGFMYGATSASSYAAAQANTYPSKILTNLNKWYANVLSKQSGFNDDQLADTIWCNDKSVVTDSTFNPNKATLGTSYGYGRNVNYYSATKRLVIASSWIRGGTGPSLKCQNDNNGGKLSKFTVNDTTNGNGALKDYAKIGLLTADEIAFAGGAYNATNSTYYIKSNANSSYCWTLSPIGYFSNYASVWGVYGSGSILAIVSVVGSDGVLRPALSLNSDTKIVSGEGSATSPYIIAV